MKFKFDSVIRQGMICIFILVASTIVPRLLLIMNAPSIYFFDSYAYVSEAIDFASSGTLQYRVGLPFIFVLGSLLKVLGSLLGAVLVSQLFMLFLSVLLVAITYLLGMEMSGRTFALLASLLAAFESYFLSFSIVPHNDVFAITMGLIAFYLATLSKKFYYILSPFFFYLAVFTRPEFYPVFGVPIIVFYFYKNLKTSLRQNIAILVFIISLYILPFAWAYSVAQAWTRFTIIEKFILFLKPDLLAIAIESTFTFYNHPLLNQVFSVLFMLGIVMCLANPCLSSVTIKRKEGLPRISIRFKNSKSIRNILKSDGAMIAFCLGLIFAIYMVTLTVYGFGYVIVDGTLEIIPWLSERYLILPRLLISFPLAYPISLVARRFYVKIAHKDQNH